MRLLVFTPSAALRGGVERIIESLGTGLPSRGIDVVVGLAKGGRFHRPDRYRREYPRLDCIDVDGTSGTREGRLRGIRRALRDVRPDAVLIARIFDAYQAVCERKLAGDSVRVGVTIDGYESDYIADLRTYREFVDFCVTSGRLIARAVERFGRFPADRIASIPGGIAAPRRRVERHGPESPLRLGYVGRIEDGPKRILDLPDLLGRLRGAGVPFRCVVAGSGTAEGELRSRLVERGLAGFVAFAGWLSPDELYERVYPEIEVFVHFSESEGITIAPREAMVHGSVPVVADFRGREEEGIFRDGETARVFPVGDTERAARLVAGLWRDRDAWERLSLAAMRSQAGERSCEGALDRWASVLRESAARPPRFGGALPRLPFPPAGRLDRWLGSRAAESVRALTGRRFLHREAGGEWPHCSGLFDPSLLARIDEFGDRSTAGA